MLEDSQCKTVQPIDDQGIHRNAALGGEDWISVANDCRIGRPPKLYLLGSRIWVEVECVWRPFRRDQNIATK